MARHVVESLNLEGLFFGGIDKDDLEMNGPMHRAKQRIGDIGGATDYDEYTPQDIVNTLLVLSTAITSHIPQQTLNYCNSTPVAPKESENMTKIRELISASNLIKLEARRVYLERKLSDNDKLLSDLQDFIRCVDNAVNAPG